MCIGVSPDSVKQPCVYIHKVIDAIAPDRTRREGCPGRNKFIEKPELLRQSVVRADLPPINFTNTYLNYL